MLKKIAELIGIAAIASWAISSPTINSCNVYSTSEAFGAEKSDLPVLKTGEKIWIEDQYYLVYNFDKRPQMGTIIMKIEVFTKEGKQDTSLEITGNADMPSMRGAHDHSGDPQPVPGQNGRQDRRAAGRQDLQSAPSLRGDTLFESARAACRNAPNLLE